MQVLAIFETKQGPGGYLMMEIPNKPKENTDEIGSDLESGNDVNQAIEKQGDDAAAAIPRDTDAAKHQLKESNGNHDLQGAP